LLMPQEVKEIGQDKEIIALENTKPILCDKIRYYEDRELKNRQRKPPEIPKLDMEMYYAKTEARVRGADKFEITFKNLIAAYIVNEINEAKSAHDIAKLLRDILLVTPAANIEQSEVAERSR
jgi:type IV secretion system protein VirD4